MRNWVGGRTISAQLEKIEKSSSDRRKRRWYARWWAWCLWIVLAILLVLFAAGLWAWSQRYTLVGDYLIDELADAGFDAELDILSATRSEAKLGAVRLTRDGEDVLRIEHLHVEYDSEDIRDIQLKRIEIDDAAARLTLGEDWRPSEDWIQDLLAGGTGNGSGGAANFPENGIFLNDSAVILRSPLGTTTLDIEASIPTQDSFVAEISLPPSDITYGGYSASGSALLTLEKSTEGAAGDILIQGSAQTETLSNSKLSIKDAQLSFGGTANIDALTYVGDISVDGRAVSSDLFAADAAKLFWTGHLEKADGYLADGRWSVSSQEARVPRRARAEELAEALSLFPAVSVVPVTEHFAPELKETVLTFLQGANVNGSGDLVYGPTGFTLSPDDAVSVETAQNNLRLMPRDGADFFKFDTAEQNILAKLDAQFRSPVGLNLTDIRLKAKSENGIRLGKIETFSADFSTANDWYAEAIEDGRPVRLGPFSAAMRYTSGARPRRLAIETALDYDGALPGGRVTGLNLDGRLDVHLYDGWQVLDFTPKESSQITLASLETPTDWMGENIRFNLPPTPNLFTRTKEKSTLAAALEMADFTLTQAVTAETSAQRLDFQSDRLILDGTLWPNRHQDWTAEFSNVQYTSETLPGPSTTASAAQANLTAKLAPDQSPQITLNSPSLTAETPLARISNFEIALSGTPQAYNVDHKGGTVDVIGSEFADAAKAAGVDSFPANGRVEFVDGRFVGQSKLVVAKADNADVDVRYEYANGAGRALIDIPSIIFKPKGLQPQTLVPAFRGKVARVDGEVRAKMNISFANGALTSSNGTVQLVDMAVGTAPGPVEGLNTTMRFASLWPLETEGPQKLTLESFNPGLPLEDGVVTFNLIPDGVRVDAADWPIGNGSLSLDPFVWKYAAPENRVIMRVKNVSLGDFLNGFGNSRIEATGNVEGVFPIVVRGIEVLVEKGEVSVPDGGIIKYDPGPGAKTYSGEEAIAVLREQRISEYADLAQDALREFKYRELSASLDGPLEGDVEIGLVFDGSNAKVLNQQPFRFDVSVKGELFNIARSFNSNAQVKAEILRQNGQLPEGTIIGE